MLTDFCDNRYTDKNSIHSYLDVYQALFQDKKESATHVLEVGIGPTADNGGSIRMWADYFQNAEVHACDIISIDQCHPSMLDHPRIHLHTSTDAYNTKFITSKFSSKKVKFDIVVDDGPHTLQSMLLFIQLYLPLLKDDGILVIEDVQDIAWIGILAQHTPEVYRPFVKLYDRRDVKGRYDDIMFVIQKKV